MRQFNFSFKAMACQNELNIYAQNEEQARSVANLAISRVNQLEQRYSRYLDDSVISQINHSSGSAEGVHVDDETAALLNYAQTCYQQSDGLFDITSGVLREVWDISGQSLPEQSNIENILELVGWEKVVWHAPKIILPIKGMQLDFGGIVKEYAADTCASLCRAQGIEHGMVNMGGDIHVIGPHPNGQPWLIGIQDPDDSEGLLTALEVFSGGLASSGDYRRYMMVDGRRYSHILNPKTGWPVHGLRAVSVLAPQCLIAGSTSTIAMLKGSEGKQWLNETGLSYLCVEESGALTTNQV